MNLRIYNVIKTISIQAWSYASNVYKNNDMIRRRLLWILYPPLKMKLWLVGLGATSFLEIFLKLQAWMMH